MNDDQVAELFNSLIKLRTTDINFINKHVQSVRDYVEKVSTNNENICPLCGGYLVVRTVKNRKNAGLKFLGCNNYPNCKYTKNV